MLNEYALVCVCGLCRRLNVITKEKTEASRFCAPFSLRSQAIRILLVSDGN